MEGWGPLSDIPEVPVEVEHVWDAFWALNSSRSIGMGVGGLPFLAIDRYADRYGVEDFETFHQLLQEMDRAYLKHTNRRD